MLLSMDMMSMEISLSIYISRYTLSATSLVEEKAVDENIEMSKTFQFSFNLLLQQNVDNSYNLFREGTNA